jgi:hypothetical protein
MKKAQLLYIEHDNAAFIDNEHGRLMWWTPRRMCVLFLP